MRKVCIDTNIYTAFKKNSPDVVEAFRKFDLIGVDCAVLAELYAGFDLGRKRKENRDEFTDFINSKRVVLFSHDMETAEFFSHIYRQLRSKGSPIPTNDIWIAATSMQHGLALYTFDQHFSAIDGILLYE
ncbi:MAG: type II toxin-antitoxin system VapC family toxin [bacterium]